MSALTSSVKCCEERQGARMGRVVRYRGIDVVFVSLRSGIGPHLVELVDKSRPLRRFDAPLVLDTRRIEEMVPFRCREIVARISHSCINHVPGRVILGKQNALVLVNLEVPSLSNLKDGGSGVVVLTVVDYNVGLKGEADLDHLEVKAGRVNDSTDIGGLAATLRVERRAIEDQI